MRTGHAEIIKQCRWFGGRIGRRQNLQQIGVPGQRRLQRLQLVFLGITVLLWSVLNTGNDQTTGGAYTILLSPFTIHQTRPRFGKSCRASVMGVPSNCATGTRVEKSFPLMSFVCCPMAKMNRSSSKTCTPEQRSHVSLELNAVGGQEGKETSICQKVGLSQLTHSSSVPGTATPAPIPPSACIPVPAPWSDLIVARVYACVAGLGGGILWSTD